MSAAYQCDVCGQLYKPTEGTVRLDVARHTISAHIEEQSWSDVDLCLACSDKVIAIIRPALLEYPE